MTSIEVQTAGSARSGMDGLMHVPIHADPQQAMDHRAFVASHLSVGLVALATLPLYLAFAHEVTGPGVIAAFMLTLPLATALYAMHMGVVERAHLISVSSSAVLLGALTAATGGFVSDVLPSLALVLGLGFAMGDMRTQKVAAGLTVGIVIAFTAIHMGGLMVGFPIDAALPLPAWLTGALIASPAMLHGAVWIHATRLISRDSARRARAHLDRQSSMMDNAADLITLHNRAGNLVQASQAATRLLGVDPSMLEDAGLFNRIHVADRPAFLRLLDLAQTGRETDPADIRIRIGDSVDGAPVHGWFEMRCRAVPGTEDIIVVLRDSGQRKAHDEAVDAAIETAERANAMKTRFLASVSHELRTPLNAIIGFSEVLEQGIFGEFSNSKHKEYAGLIHQSGRHLLDVVNDILDMSKIEAGKFEIVPEPFDAEQVLVNCAAILGNRADENGVTVRLAIEPHLPELTADQRALKQIGLNLLSNAIKFTRENTAEGRSEVVIGARRKGDCLHITFKDNGIGISTEDLAHVGEPFYQAHSSYDRSYEGTGLGLSVVRGLVDLHGGRMTIDSTLGKGTTVTIVLPLAGPSDTKAVAESVIETLPSRPRNADGPRATVAADLALVEPLTRKAG
ncbi:ATP-binding protein [Tepidamorphus sp. 3E244]|uniref:ATP-binding protein n=1 Tax=Tepidamorphus sp. 3E244 TaxID=3385498 RepID=UPI0038FBFE2F